jgi:hypothetical protein
MNIKGARIQVEADIVRAGYAIEYAKSNRGRVYFVSRRCIIPQIKSRATLYVACHELGHVVEGYVKPVYIGEYRAELYAHDKMRELGFSVPRKATARAREYVSMKIRRAKKRGLKSVSSQVGAWANLTAKQSRPGRGKRACLSYIENVPGPSIRGRGEEERTWTRERLRGLKRTIAGDVSLTSPVM